MVVTFHCIFVTAGSNSFPSRAHFATHYNKMAEKCVFYTKQIFKLTNRLPPTTDIIHLT